jgi:archaellum component FlaC
MATKSETDFKELKDLINNQFQEINTRFQELDKRIEQLDKKVDLGFTEIKGEIKRIDVMVTDVSKKADSIESRINGQTNLFIGILSVLVAGLLGILAKIAVFPNP